MAEGDDSEMVTIGDSCKIASYRRRSSRGVMILGELHFVLLLLDGGNTRKTFLSISCASAT